MDEMVTFHMGRRGGTITTPARCAPTRAEWEAKGAELFGPDLGAWRFKCPACGLVASVDLARANWPEVKGKGWHPESECIGRYTDKAGCDWAAWGLFAGPLFVRTDEDPIPAFDFDGLPYTSGLTAASERRLSRGES